jgi:hypothetical protein
MSRIGERANLDCARLGVTDSKQELESDAYILDLMLVILARLSYQACAQDDDTNV